MRRTGLVGSWLGAVAVGAVASGDVVVIEPGKDNTIFANGNSNGAGDSLFSGRTGNFSGQIVQRAVIAFDVAGVVPAGATIQSASLSLYLLQASAMGGPTTHDLRRLLADWGEGMSMGVGGAGDLPQEGDATWTNTFYPDQLWAVAGGDFSLSTSSSQTIGTLPGRYDFGSSPAMVADVQTWLDDPASSFGWIVIGDEVTPNSSKRFGSREIFDAGFRPLLTIEFEPPPPPPCPWDCGGDGNDMVDTVDFLALLGQWGQLGTSCDFSGGGVDTVDFLELLGHWGPCPK